MIHRLAAIATLAVVIGFISIPLAVWRASSPKLGGLTMELRANVPAGPIDQKWDTHRFEMKLVNPANKRRFNIIVVGSGLAGASAARRSPSWGIRSNASASRTARAAPIVAAQGASTPRKTIATMATASIAYSMTRSKVATTAPREANVHRLAQISGHIIGQCGAGRAVRT